MASKKTLQDVIAAGLVCPDCGSLMTWYYFHRDEAAVVYIDCFICDDCGYKIAGASVERHLASGNLGDAHNE